MPPLSLRTCEEAGRLAGALPVGRLVAVPKFLSRREGRDDVHVDAK